jgi:hypothetical protein
MCRRARWTKCRRYKRDLSHVTPPDGDDLLISVADSGPDGHRAEAGEVSAAEWAERVGISPVSARRYLEHYLSTGALEIRL